MQSAHIDDLLKSAGRHVAEKRRGAALDALRKVVDSPGASIDAIVRASELLEQAKAPGEAARGYGRALALGGPNSRLYYLQGRSYSDAGDYIAGEKSLRSALSMQPEHPQAHNELGIVLAETQRPSEAVGAFQAALRLDPKYAQAYNNLGNALRALGRFREAATAFGQAARAKPNYALALFNLGLTLRDLGQQREAESALRASVAANPKYRPALVALANLCRQAGRLDDAASAYYAAFQIDPRSGAAELAALGAVLAERGDYEQARHAYSTALTQAPSNLRANLGLRLPLRMIYRDRDEIDQLRRTFGNGVAKLQANIESLAPVGDESAIENLVWTNFLLAYHGEDDRPLQEAYAAFVAAVADRSLPRFRQAVAPARRGDGRIRVGFASTFFTEGTVGMYFRRWVTDLARDPFDVYVYHLAAGMNPVATELAQAARVFRHLPVGQPRIQSLATIVSSDALDVLIYPEIGMDWTCFTLAALRLAPIQCAAWGHPVTTGQPTIDHFFSSAAMEPEGAQAHYTEHLVTLPNLGTRYPRPKIPGDATRAQFGLPEDTVLLLCPQSLFKIHPDNDELFARVVAAVDRARLLLFEGRHPAITDQFMRRLGEAFKRHGLDVRERTVVLPQINHQDYLRVNQVCDVMLDTLRWSGGNTSLDAIACGLPIVTLPGAYMRGRQSAAMLQLAGLGELVVSDPDEYVAKVRALADDADLRHSIRARVLAGSDRLFDDPAPIAALAEFLRAAVPAPAEAP